MLQCTLTGHFNRYVVLVLDSMTFDLLCPIAPWHRFRKLLETFLRDFGKRLHDAIIDVIASCSYCRGVDHHVPRGASLD